MLRDAEMEMKTDIRRGCRERQKRRERGRRRRETEEGGRVRERGGGRRETERASCFIHGW